VREKVEAALFAGDLDRLSTFSRRLTEAISSMASQLKQEIGTQTVMAGGDDVLFTVEASRFALSTLEKAAATFSVESGCSMSFGVGFTLEDAYINLRKAKSSVIGIVAPELER
jgi:hypothetical protein